MHRDGISNGYWELEEKKKFSITDLQFFVSRILDVKTIIYYRRFIGCMFFFFWVYHLGVSREKNRICSRCFNRKNLILKTAFSDYRRGQTSHKRWCGIPSSNKNKKLLLSLGLGQQEQLVLPGSGSWVIQWEMKP